MKWTLLGTLLLSSLATAQVSIDRFITSSTTASRDSLRAIHRGKTIEESEVAGYKAFVVHDRMEGKAVRLGYLFAEGGRLAGQTLGTANADDSTAEWFFSRAKALLVDRLGSSFKEMSLLETVTLAWNGLADRSVTLTKRARSVTITMFFRK